MKQLVAVVFLCAAAGSTGMAQVSKPLPQRPGQESAAEPLPQRRFPTRYNTTLEPGAYSLVLTPTRISGKPAPKTASPMTSSVTVSQNGRIISVNNADGLSLSGGTSGARIIVSGQNGDAKLTLSGAATKDGAKGDFKLTLNGGPQVVGGFVLASQKGAATTTSYMRLKDYTPPSKNSGDNCNWWCKVKKWTSF
jgi:Glycoprotein GP40 of Cryptosporidium.